MMTTRRRTRPEEQFQIAVCDYLKIALPEDTVYFFINNGHKLRSMRILLARLGQRSGIPDLCIVYRGKPVFIELKSKRGVISVSQRATQSALVLAGAVVHTVKTIEALDAFLRLLMPMRGTLIVRAA